MQIGRYILPEFGYLRKKIRGWFEYLSEGGSMLLFAAASTADGR